MTDSPATEGGIAEEQRSLFEPRENVVFFAGLYLVVNIAVNLTQFIPGIRDFPNLQATIGWINILSMLSGALALYLYRRSLRKNQRELNANTAVLDTSEKFILYLRPFMTSGRIPVRNGLSTPVERLITGTYWDLEFALAYALDQMTPAIRFVAVGEVKGVFGAAKVTVSDEGWKERMLALARDAALIVLVPLNRPSTLWETETIFNNPELRRKTLFLMPPSSFWAVSIFRTAWRFLCGTTLQQFWSQARKALAAKGIHLPEFQKNGMLFGLSADGEAVGSIPANDFYPRYVEFILDKLSAEGRTSGAPLPDIRENAEFEAVRADVERQRKEQTRWYKYLFRVSIQGGWQSVPLIIVAVILHAFVFELFNIPSGSMIPTLLVGDYLYVSKWAHSHGHAPERGDVVVFKLPSDNKTDYIKRVIGLPGDTVQMEDGRLFINGVLVERERIDDLVYQDTMGDVLRLKQYRETLPGGRIHYILEEGDDRRFDNTPEYRLPADYYFMMGDNRDHSMDSRGDVGFVPAKNLIGRAEFLYFSTDGTAHWWEVWRWPTATRFGRFFNAIH